MSDREKVVSTLEEIKTQAAGIGLNSAVISHKFIDKIITLLKEQGAVVPKQGKWIYCEAESGQDGYKCSECGFFEPWYYDFENHNFITDYAYCPSCGKPMQKGL